jgi:hypothetical protein
MHSLSCPEFDKAWISEILLHHTLSNYCYTVNFFSTKVIGVVLEEQNPTIYCLVNFRITDSQYFYCVAFSQVIYQDWDVAKDCQVI